MNHFHEGLQSSQSFQSHSLCRLSERPRSSSHQQYLIKNLRKYSVKIFWNNAPSQLGLLNLTQLFSDMPSVYRTKLWEVTPYIEGKGPWSFQRLDRLALDMRIAKLYYIFKKPTLRDILFGYPYSPPHNDSHLNDTDNMLDTCYAVRCAEKTHVILIYKNKLLIWSFSPPLISHRKERVINSQK